MQTNTFFKTLSAAALAVVLAACGGQKDSAPAAASAASPAADNGAAKKEIVFGTTVGDFGDMVKDQIKPALEKKVIPSNCLNLPTTSAPTSLWQKANWTSTFSNTSLIWTTSKKNTN